MYTKLRETKVSDTNGYLNSPELSNYTRYIPGPGVPLGIALSATRGVSVSGNLYHTLCPQSLRTHNAIKLAVTDDWSQHPVKAVVDIEIHSRHRYHQTQRRCEIIRISGIYSDRDVQLLLLNTIATTTTTTHHIQ